MEADDDGSFAQHLLGTWSICPMIRWWLGDDDDDAVASGRLLPSPPSSCPAISCLL